MCRYVQERISALTAVGHPLYSDCFTCISPREALSTNPRSSQISKPASVEEFAYQGKQRHLMHQPFCSHHKAILLPMKSLMFSKFQCQLLLWNSLVIRKLFHLMFSRSINHLLSENSEKSLDIHRSILFIITVFASNGKVVVCFGVLESF